MKKKKVTQVFERVKNTKVLNIIEKIINVIQYINKIVIISNRGLLKRMFSLRFNFLIVLFILLFFSMCVVCAQENNTVDESLSMTGTYCDLEKEIDNLEPNETIKLTQDYEYNENEYDQNNPFIEIKKDNITINGNNHIINSKNKSSFFKITGHHVKIINLKLINAQAQLQKSNDNFWVSDLISISTNPPINWLGDYGILENCTIQNSKNLNNGIIEIQGQNNKIENIKFINNTIKYGSTIYLKICFFQKLV